MNILEAINSGASVKLGTTVFTASELRSASLPFDLVASTDWEIYNPSVSVTKASLVTAWNSCRPSSGSVASAEDSPMFKRIVAALGLE